VEVEGILISWSGLAKRASSCAAVCDLGERARFLVGRLERGSAEVGMLSGMASDIVMVLWIVCVGLCFVNQYVLWADSGCCGPEQFLTRVTSASKFLQR